jgi:hypothetical protein
MTTKRWLVAIPFVVVALLVQSALWVPRYETQGVDNPGRLTTYIELGIGDAQILNPILSADKASSEVTQLVFDGLIDVNEEQQWTGDLAERWETTEEAYLTILPGRTLPDGSAASASLVAGRIRDALASGPLVDLAAVVREVEVVVAETRELDVSVVEVGEDGQPLERQQPLFPLRLIGRRPEQLHVAGDGGIAVEHFGRPGKLGHLLENGRELEVSQPGAGLILAQVRKEQVP